MVRPFQRISVQAGTNRILSVVVTHLLVTLATGLSFLPVEPLGTEFTTGETYCSNLVSLVAELLFPLNQFKVFW